MMMSSIGGFSRVSNTTFEKKARQKKKQIKMSSFTSLLFSTINQSQIVISIKRMFKTSLKKPNGFYQDEVIEKSSISESSNQGQSSEGRKNEACSTPYTTLFTSCLLQEIPGQVRSIIFFQVPLWVSFSGFVQKSTVVPNSDSQPRFVFLQGQLPA